MFITYWLNLMRIVRSVSIRFDKIKDKIKLRHIKEYHGAGLYDQNLTMKMLNNLMEAGGTTNKDFRHPLRNLKAKLTPCWPSGT